MDIIFSLLADFSGEFAATVNHVPDCGVRELSAKTAVTAS
jgi:hypothetical protein